MLRSAYCSMIASTRVSPAHADDSTGDEEAPTHPPTAVDDGFSQTSDPLPRSRVTQRRGSAAVERRGSWFDNLERQASLAAEQRDSRRATRADWGRVSGGVTCSL